MASFNPQPNDTGVPNNTTRASSTGPNRSFEALFSGLGDFITDATTTADTRVKSNIENDARYGFDSLNDETNLSVDTTTGGKIPPDLVRSQDGLSKLAQAHIQGKITPEYYYQRLASQLKGLRAKYPGYEKEVDDIVSNVTGTRPANAYRDALFQNIQNEQQLQASKAGQFQKWLLNGSNSGIAVTMYPDIFTNPDKYSTPDKQAEVMTTVETQQGRVQITKNASELQNADKNISGPALSKWISANTQSHIAGGLEGTTVGKDGNILGAALQDGVISPEEKTNILAYTTMLKQKTRQDILSQWTRGDIGKNFSQSEVNKMIDDSLAGVTEIEQSIQSGNMSQAGQLADRLKATQDQNTLDLYQQFPELKAANAIGQFSQGGADKLMQEIIDKNGGGQGFLDKVLSRDMTQSALSGNLSFDKQIDILDATKGKTEKQKEAILSSTLNSQIDILKSGKLQPEQVRNYVNLNYDKGIDKLFASVDDSLVDGQSQRFRLYQKMFDPRVTAAIKASNDPEALKKYTAAAMDKAQQVPEFRRAAADLQGDIDYSKFVKVAYDPETNKIEMKVNKDALLSGALAQKFMDPAQRMDQIDTKIAQISKAATSYNQVLSSLSPIIEANGGDETKGVAEFSHDLNLNLNGGQGRGFFDYIDKSLNDLSTAKTPVKTDENGKEVKSPTADWEDVPSVYEKPDGEVEWNLGNSEDQIEKAKSLPTYNDLDKDVIPDSKDLKSQEKNLKVGMLEEKDSTPSAFKTFDRGLASLVTSRKRGYQPDLSGLQSGFKSDLVNLQKAFGEEITIVSGYRDPARNKKAGGAKHSQHMNGDAIDIDVSDWNKDKRIRFIQMAREHGFGGIGIYPNSIHIDKGRTRAWGPNFHNETLPRWAREVL